MNKMIYADNAATTKVSSTVYEAMLPWIFENYGNPSSIYRLGREARAAVDKSRRQVATALGCQPGEVYFTSGGSEADNWAIKGTARSLAAKGKKHIITTNFEHHAVLHTCAALEKEGFTVTYLPVDEKGLITPRQVKEAIRPDTALVTIMYANNEIGTVLPIAEIGAVCRAAGVLFHTDAVQAVGHLHVNVSEQNIDMLSLSAHKFHGPKGVGVLYVKKGPMPLTLIDGGGQEKGRRAGTENISGIVGLGAAITEAVEKIDESTARISAMRDKLIAGLLKLPRVRLNGDATHRLPGNVNVSFEGIEGESLLLMLDNADICASSGSACTSGSLDPSHVLLAIGLPHEIAHGSLRLSLGDENTMDDVNAILERVPPIAERLRSMSPVWERLMKE
ncbi:MAG: cysteine desulfurase NifS [Angelakisella sp.]